MRPGLAIALMLLLAAPMGLGEQVDDTVHLGPGTHAYPDGLIVPDGARLVLSGAHLELGGVLHVEPGGELVFEDGVRIDGGGEGWLLIEGAWTTSGTHVLSGLAGEGMAAIGDGVGGVQILSHVAIAGITLQNSGAGFVVAHGASLDLRDGALLQTGMAGVAVIGRAALTNMTIEGGFWAVTGRGQGVDRGAERTCSIDIAQSALVAQAAPLGVNSCEVRVAASVLRGGNVGIDASAKADVTLVDVAVEGYRLQGADLRSLPDQTGGTLRPSLTAANVTFHPAPGGGAPGSPKASLGVQALGSTLHLERVGIQGHSGHGIQVQSSNLTLDQALVQGNGGHGLAAVGSAVRGIETSDFTTSPNALGAVDVKLRFVVGLLRDGRAADPAAHLHVMDAAGNVVYEEDLGADGVVTAEFAAYSEGIDGPVFAGPFRYRLESATIPAGLNGDIPPHGGRLVLEAPPAAGGSNVVQWLLLGGGFLFLAAAVLPRWHRRQTKET